MVGLDGWMNEVFWPQKNTLVKRRILGCTGVHVVVDVGIVVHAAVDVGIVVRVVDRGIVVRVVDRGIVVRVVVVAGEW
jgi:hypothetical protein